MNGEIDQLPARLLTTGDVSAILGLAPATVLCYIKEGRLQASLIGKQYRISEDELLRFIRGGVR